MLCETEWEAPVFGDVVVRARSGWMAVLLTGVALLGSVPLYAGFLPRGYASYTAEPAGVEFRVLHVSPGLGRLGRLASGGSSTLGLYWLVAVPAVYALLGLWFVLRARRTGLQQRWGVYVGGSLLLFSVLLLSVLPVSDPAPPVLRQVTSPLLLLAGSVIVLGLVERDRRLVVLGAVGAAVAVLVGLVIHGGPVMTDSLPGEPVLSAVSSAQGGVALLGAAFVICGLLWRPRRARRS
jgi:hypothetical protein